MSRRSRSYSSIDIFHPEVTEDERNCLRNAKFQTNGDWMYDFVRDICVVHDLKCSAVFRQCEYIVSPSYGGATVALSDKYGTNVYMIATTTGKGNNRSLYNSLYIGRYTSRGTSGSAIITSSQRAYLLKSVKNNLHNDKVDSKAGFAVTDFLQGIGHEVLTNSNRCLPNLTRDRDVFTLQGDKFLSLMHAVSSNLPTPQSVIEHLTTAKVKYDNILAESNEYNRSVDDLLSGEKWIIGFNYFTGYQLFSVDFTDFNKSNVLTFNQSTVEAITQDKIRFHGFTRNIDTFPTEVSESLKAAYTMHAIQVANTDEKSDVYPAPSLLPLDWNRTTNQHRNLAFSVPWNIANPRPVLEVDVNLCSATAHYSHNATETQWLMINKI